VSVAQALLYAFALISVGALLHWRGWFAATGFQSIERFVYFVAFPCMLSVNIADSKPGASSALLSVVLIIASIGIIASLCFSYAETRESGAKWYAVVVQGSIRPNSYFSLSTGSLILSPDSFSVMVILLGATLPIVNVISLYALANGKLSRGEMFTALLKNPVIIAMGMGLLIYLVGGMSVFPKPVDKAITTLGSTALPLGLVAIGFTLASNLGINSIKEAVPVLCLTGIVKLLALPICVGLLGALAGIEADALSAMVFLSAAPTAPNAYVMTKLMHGDHALMAQVIVMSTLLAFLTIPIVLWLTGQLRSAGL
jgi:malonate transporter and related proteins